MSKKLLIGLLGIFFFSTVGLLYYYLSKPTISVIMPTYNRANFLQRSIPSILNQTYSDFEFIIVDDGSTDHTEQVLLGFANKDKRIKIVKNEENKGLIYSRNKALDLAKGEYIAIMDSDDQAFPNRFEKSLKVFEENSDIHALSAVTYDIRDKINPEVFLRWNDYHIIDNDVVVSLMFSNIFPNPAAMFKADFVKEHKIRYNENYKSAEDYDFWKQFVFAGGKLILIHEPLTLIRRHSSNTDDYYQQMDDTSKQIHKEFIERFFVPKEEEVQAHYTPYMQCKILSKIMDANKKKNIIDQEKVVRFYKKRCPTDLSSAYYLRHLGWEDFISQEDGKFIRLSTKEDVFIDKKGDVLEVSFVDKSAVKFKKHPSKDVYYHYGDNALVLKHNFWEDEIYLVCEKNNKYCRFTNQDCGTVIKKPKGVIEIEWDNPYYPIEKFVFDKKTNKYIQK